MPFKPRKYLCVTLTLLVTFIMLYKISSIYFDESEFDEEGYNVPYDEENLKFWQKAEELSKHKQSQPTKSIPFKNPTQGEMNPGDKKTLAKSKNANEPNDANEISNDLKGGSKQHNEDRIDSKKKVEEKKQNDILKKEEKNREEEKGKKKKDEKIETEKVTDEKEKSKKGVEDYKGNKNIQDKKADTKSSADKVPEENKSGKEQETEGRSGPEKDVIETPKKKVKLPRKVLLFNTGRSGGAVISRILVNHDDTALFYLPFSGMSGLDEIDICDHLSRMYACDDSLLSMNYKHIPLDATYLERCKASSTIVVTMITFSLRTFYKCLKYMDDVKIIVLQRDPRGILSSMKHSGGFESYTIEKVCEVLEANVLYSKFYSSERLLSVKFESFCENTETMVEEIYKFVGLDFLSTDRDYLQALRVDENQMKGQDIVQKEMRDNFGIIRAQSYDPNYWKKEISPRDMTHWSFICQNVISILQYDND